MDYVWALILGAGFGMMLNKSGMTKYHRIANVFRLTDMTVIKFMLTALVTGMIGVFGLQALGWLKITSVPGTYIVGNLVGGLIFGVGMSLVGL